MRFESGRLIFRPAQGDPMFKSHRAILLVLLIAVAACGGFAAFKFMRGSLPWPETSFKNLTRVDVITPKSAYALYKDGEHWMLLTGEGHCRSAEERIKQLIDALGVIGKDKETWSDASLPDAEQSLGITLATEKTSWRVVVDTSRSEHIPADKVRVIVKQDENAKAMLVDARLAKLLELPAAEYADLRLFDLKPERITRLSVNTPGMEEWDLSRVQDGVFRFLKPQRMQHVELAQVAIEFYLYAVTSMRSPEFLQDKETLDDPLPEKLLEVQIWSEGEEKPEQLVIYHQVDTAEFGPFVAYSSRQNGYLTVPAAKVQQLGNSLLSLRNHPVLPQGIGQVDRVMLTTWNDKGEPRQYVFIRENDEWRRSGTKESLVGMDALIWRLGTMQTDGKNGESAPKNPVRLMRWDFFRHNSNAPILVLSFSNEQDKEGIKSWVQVGLEGPWFPLQGQVISEILGHLPTPLEN